MAFRFGLYFLAITLLGLVFEIAEPIERIYFPGAREWFILSTRKMHFSSMIYYTIEHIIPLLLTLIVAVEVLQARFYASVFCWLQFFDTLDFWVTAHSAWIEINGWPVTFNIIRVATFVIMLTYGIIRDILTSRFAS